MAQLQDFLLVQTGKTVIGIHVFQFAQTGNPFLNRLEVGQHAAQPAFIDKEHVATQRFVANRFLRLFLCPDEQHGFAFLGNATDKIISIFHFPDSFLQVNDIDAVSLRKDIRSHFGIPSSGLMTEMNPRLEKLFHGYNGHKAPPVFSSVTAGFRSHR